MTEPIRVLLVDDHTVVRKGLAKILGEEPDISVVGEARDGLEAIVLAAELRPDVVLMDIFMPDCSGLEATIAIKHEVPDTRILVLTISDRDEDLFQALRFGARGYLLKSAAAAEVVEGVRRTAAGETMLSPHMVATLVAGFQNKGDEPKLSTREIEVLDMLGEGSSNSEMARRLLIGESTVRTYIRRLLDKLHLRHRAEGIAYAARRQPSTKRIGPIP